MQDSELRFRLSSVLKDGDSAAFRSLFEDLVSSDVERAGISNSRSGIAVSDISPEIWVLFGEAAIKACSRSFPFVIFYSSTSMILHSDVWIGS